MMWLRILVSVGLMLWPSVESRSAEPSVSHKPLWKTLEKNAGTDSQECRSAQTFSSLAKSLNRPVVGLEVQFDPAYLKSAQRGKGSGFFIRSDGYLVTNHHVVDRAASIFVRTSESNEPQKARVVGADAYSDLALLKVDLPHEVAVLPLGDSGELPVGSWVAAVASPYGLSGMVTVGIISGKGRILRDLNEGKSGAFDLIQTDALIAVGSSGGALINPCGEVVGVITAANRRARGIGFAVPIDLVKEVLPRLLRDGELQRAYLGIRVDTVPWNIAVRAGLKKPVGVLVTKVIPDTPASRSGLETGDILLKISGHTIRGPGDMNWRASTALAGKKTRIDLRRGDATLALNIVPVARKEKRKSMIVRKPAGPYPESIMLGLRVVDRDPSDETQPDPSRGVIVVGFDSESAAKRLRIGDVIVEVQGEKTPNTEAFRKAMQRCRHRKAVRLTLLRQGRIVYVAL